MVSGYWQENSAVAILSEVEANCLESGMNHLAFVAYLSELGVKLHAQKETSQVDIAFMQAAY